MKTFTIRQAALWCVLAAILVVAIASMFIGGFVSLFGISLTCNFYLSWLIIGHERMLALLGLNDSAQHDRPQPPPSQPSEQV